MTNPNKAEEAARKELTKILGSNKVEITARETANVPGTNEQLVRFTGADSDDPNSPAQVVVDVTGTVLNLAELEARIGRQIFEFDTDEVAALEGPVPERVSIDPPRNDLALPFCRQEAEHLTITIPKSEAPPKADVYLLTDTTGSMVGVLTPLKTFAASLIGHPALAAFDVAIGVGSYRDFPNTSYVFQHQLSPTKVATDLVSAISSWTASGGEDWPEGQLFALHRLATDPAIGWRPGARRIVLWFGDAPGHDPVCTAFTGEPADITEASVTAELQRASMTVVAVSIDLGLDGDPTVPTDPFPAYPMTCGAPRGMTGQASRITAATGGAHLTGINPAGIAATLKALIETTVTSIGNVRLMPSSGISDLVESVTPSGGYGPLPGNTEHRLGFDVLWTGTRRCTEKDQVVTGTLDVVVDSVVVAQKPVRITIPACRYHHAVEILCGTFNPAGPGQCETVVAGHYATAVTIYNPWSCPVSIEKCFTPLVLRNEAVGREPAALQCRPFAEINLGPREATMDDCCSLETAIGPISDVVTLGVLDIIAYRPLEVTAIMTATSRQQNAASVHTRHVEPRSDA